jgi:hypothetical protein
MNRSVKFSAFVLVLILGSYLALARQAPQSAAQQHPMTFFVTSTTIGNGGNLGGLAGADAHCQALATAVGAGNHAWHAYMSTQAQPDHPDQPAINARDRIGQGPWYNAKGDMVARDLATLHGDTLELARLGNNVTKLTSSAESLKLRHS